LQLDGPTPTTPHFGRFASHLCFHWERTALRSPRWSQASAHWVRFFPSVLPLCLLLRVLLGRRLLSLLRICAQTAFTTSSMPVCLCRSRNRGRLASRCRSSGGVNVSVSRTGIRGWPDTRPQPPVSTSSESSLG